MLVRPGRMVFNAGFERVVDRRMDLSLIVRGFAAEGGARHIAEIAVPVGADIDEYDVAMSDDLVAAGRRNLVPTALKTKFIR